MRNCKVLVLKQPIHIYNAVVPNLWGRGPLPGRSLPSPVLSASCRSPNLVECQPNSDSSLQCPSASPRLPVSLSSAPNLAAQPPAPKSASNFQQCPTVSHNLMQCPLVLHSAPAKPPASRRDCQVPSEIPAPTVSPSSLQKSNLLLGHQVYCRDPLSEFNFFAIGAKKVL